MDLTPHWRQAYENKFFGAWDLWSEKKQSYFEVMVRIDRVTREEVIGEMGRKTWPLLIYCSGPKKALPAPYIVTKTSGKTLEIMFGENPSGWVGKTVTFYVRREKKVRKGTGAVLVIRNTKGNQDMIEELKVREKVDEDEFAAPARDSDGPMTSDDREPGQEG